MGFWAFAYRPAGMARPRRRRAAPAGLAGALALALACALAVETAHAQDTANSGPGFWLQDRARTARPRPGAPAAARQKVRRLVPNRALARPTVWPNAPLADPSGPLAPESAPPSPDAAAPAGAPAASPAPTTPVPRSGPAALQPAAPRIAVVGDSLAIMLAQALSEPPEERPFVILRKGKESSGLVRDDFYDWTKALREVLDGPEKVDGVALMVGSNDRQELRDETGRLEPLSPRWLDVYARRVEALTTLLQARGAPFVWVGLPIMKYERYSADMKKLNDIYRARVEAAGGRYVDVWEALADETGRYSAFGPDVAGQIVKLRASDGVHLTKAGAQKLAHFVEPHLKALSAPPTAPDAADGYGLVPPPPFLLSPQGLVAPNARPAPPTPAPASPLAPPKPEIGPVQALTATPVAPEGQLAGAERDGAYPGDGRSARPDGPFSSSPAPALDEGRTPPPKPGRIDDFAWPRPR